jgi:hypothetical protein
MKSFVAIAFVGCLIVAAFSQEQQHGVAPVADFASIPEEEVVGSRVKRQFGYGG